MAGKKRKNDDEDDKPPPPDLLLSLFPAGKVKANLQINEDVGTIRRPAEKLVEFCAAVFLQKLIQDASTAKDVSDTASDSETAATAVIQLEHIQAAAANNTTHYEFLMDDLQEVQDSTAPKAARLYRQAKKRRLVSSKSSGAATTKVSAAQLAQVQQVMDQEQDESSSNHVGTNFEMIEDEDDYD
mmetsp:Transcript_30861/g.50986  ORF Transcript_30861/g.50986 Transcript_30861/m.50986 type:complete len:185 (-) Transcript_30861:333-887(-)|eukprot:CAMPEP_0119017878 /NCGR_PEP_ID=MMETSP1176-20130426/17941_1 /TAXON_ID=265551 /ORGANISM="Synedropsis recta cf, Strain CCMP1620" /LENGTH=184 /DNA_ID=CAMNT_0006971727 /DNA_START=8 /DNA_END=562 /DNA_ORIENTATION=-